MTSTAYSGCSEHRSLSGSLLSEGSCVDALSLAGSSPQDEAALGSSSELFFPGDSSCWRASQSTARNGDNKELTKDSASYINRMFRQQMLLEQRSMIEQQELSGGNGSCTDAGVRMIVVSWMVEVAEEFRLQQETLHMAVLLFDRFLADSEEVPRCVLQLLAVGCILLAAKDLEVSQPTVEQLCAVTANHFQPRDLLRMERIILNVLDFRLSGPSCYTFLHLFAQACSNWVTPAVLSLAMYLCELAMLDSHTSSISYSSKAASALLLAQLSLGSPIHTPFIQVAVMTCLGVDTLQGLSPCLAMLLRLQQIAYQHTLAAVSVSGAAQQGAMSLHMPAPAQPATGHPPGQQSGPPPAPNGQQQPEDMLAPLRIKFGAECWCNVSIVPPLALLPMQV